MTAQLKSSNLSLLIDTIDSVPGKKILILDRLLSGPISLIAKFSLLQDHGVERIYWLENLSSIDDSQDAEEVVYLCRPSIPTTLKIAAHIKLLLAENQSKYKFTVVFTPRRTLASMRIFEEEGVLGDIVILEYPLLFLPLEPDLLSLELSKSFEELYLDGDYSSIYTAATALMNLQQENGLFPRIIGKGDLGSKLHELLLRLRKEVDAEESKAYNLLPSATYENLVIIDRSIDFVSPLMTQLTYEGLLDEYYGVKNTQIEVDSAIVSGTATNSSSSNPTSQIPQTSTSASTNNSKKKKITLSSADVLFPSIRDENFTVIGAKLGKTAKRVQEDMASRHNATTLKELKEFSGRLGSLQTERDSLTLHLGLADQIMKFANSELFSRFLEVQQNLVAGAEGASQHPLMEELIAQSAPLRDVLRLLCLECLVNDGLKVADLDFFKREILQSYGARHILTFANLQKAHLLYARGTGVKNPPYAFSNLRRALRLYVEEVNEREPNDVSYVYSGYAPLSVRLLQSIIQKNVLQGNFGNKVGLSSVATGWRGFEDVVRHNIRGKMFDENQRGQEQEVQARRILSKADVKTTVVFFLGGITYAEIAAIRLIQKQGEGRRKILIATTSIISGNSILDSVIY